MFLNSARERKRGRNVFDFNKQNQLTLSKEIREYLGLKTGDRIQFEINETGKVELSPIKATLMDLKGLLPPPKKKVTLADMRGAIEEEGGKT